MSRLTAVRSVYGHVELAAVVDYLLRSVGTLDGQQRVEEDDEAAGIEYVYFGVVVFARGAS